MNCIVCDCDRDRGVSVLFGAPSMHRIYGLSLAWHWQLGGVHVHFMSQYWTVYSWIMLLWFHALVCRIGCVNGL